MTEFLYIYRGGEAPKAPAEGQQHMQRWVAWIKELGDRGHVKAPGSPVESTGKVVSGKAKVVSDGPYGKAEDLIGGYTQVTAKDIDEAVELTKDCPIFHVGGAVEVRPILQIKM